MQSVNPPLKKGDIFLTEVLSPKSKHTHEQEGYRPWLVVSDEALSANTPFVIAIPFTTAERKLETQIDWDLLATGSQTRGTLMTEQVKCIDLASRQFKVVEHVKVPEAVDNMLRLLMNL